MYKYDSQNKWILLDVNRDAAKINFCMVEDGFTGALFLEKNGNTLHGYWVNPRATKQFKVELFKQNLDIEAEAGSESKKRLDEILFDELIYAKNDC